MCLKKLKNIFVVWLNLMIGYLKDYRPIVFVKCCSFEITIQDGGFHSSNFIQVKLKLS